MKLISRRTPDYTLPATDANWVVRGNPTHTGLIDRLDAPKVIRCLAVDDEIPLLGLMPRIVASLSAKIVAASKTPEGSLLSLEAYVPQNNRSDLAVLDEAKVAQLIELFGKAGVTVSKESMSKAIANLLTEERPSGVMNGLEAALICAVTPIDLVLSDLDMPFMTGNGTFAVSRQSGAVLRAPSFVFLSGDFKAAAPEELLSMGAATVVHKPYNVIEFARAVNYALFGVLSTDPKDCFELRE